MAVPKRKTSKSKRNKRRTHQKTLPPNLSTCPDCGEAKLPMDWIQSPDKWCWIPSVN